MASYEAYFDDTLIYHQADFTAGVTRFTITLPPGPRVAAIFLLARA